MDSELDADMIDSAFDSVVMSEQRLVNQGFKEGLIDGSASGYQNGFVLGVKNGSVLHKELGFYRGFSLTWLKLIDLKTANKSSVEEKARSSLLILNNLIDQFPFNEPRNIELHQHLANIRSKFRQVCSLLGLSPSFDVGATHGFSF